MAGSRSRGFLSFRFEFSSRFGFFSEIRESDVFFGFGFFVCEGRLVVAFFCFVFSCFGSLLCGFGGFW